jgi:hypothetical protein
MGEAPGAGRFLGFGDDDIGYHITLAYGWHSQASRLGEEFTSNARRRDGTGHCGSKKATVDVWRDVTVGFDFR